MAKDKPVDFDKLDLDDLDIDFGFDDFDESGPQTDSGSNRKPIEEFKANIKQGVKSRLLDKGLLRRLVGMSLPKGYNQAFNAYDGLTDGISKLYAENQAGLMPYARKIKMRMDRSNSAMKHLLPQSLKKLIDESGESSTSSSYEDGQSELSINLEGVDKLFQLQVADKLEQTVKNARDEQIDKNRFDLEMAARIEMGKGIGRLVGYQDSILINYHRKTLEIGYRQLDITTRAFLATTKYYGDSMRMFDSIRHNTALPDYLKLRSSELMKQQIAARIADTTLGSAGRWAKNYFENIRKNASEYIDAALMMKEEIDSAAELGGSRAGMAGMVAGQFAGQAAGNVAEWLAGQAASYTAPLLEKVPGIKKFGNVLQDRLTGIPQRINEYTKSETTREGLLGIAEESLKSLLGRHTADRQLGGLGIEKMDEPAVFDTLVHRSITDIIPGYLASIDKWIRTLATGQEQDEQVWSHYRAELVSRKSTHAMHLERVIEQGGGSAVRGRIDDLMREIGTDSLSLAAIKALRRQLMKDMLEGNDFVPGRYVKTQTWNKEPEEIAEELIEHIAERFGLDIAGNRTGNDETIDNRLRTTREKFIETSNALPDFTKRMSIFRDVVGRRAWREMGLTQYDGREGDIIDLFALTDMIANRELNPQQGPQPSPGGRGGNVPPFGPVSPSAGQGQPVPQGSPITTEINWPELFKTSDEKTHERLDRLLERMDINNVLLDAINQHSGGGEGGSTPTPGSGNRFSLLSKLMEGGLSVGKGLKNYLTGSYSLLGKGAKWGMGALGSLAKLPFQVRDGLGVSDVHTAGDPEPVLTARNIRLGRYLDINTGEIIRKLADITGPVKNLLTGDMALTQEQFDQGLVNGEGESLAHYLGSKGLSIAGSLGKGLFNYTKGAYGLMGRVVQGGYNFVRDQLTQFDAYFPGEDEPRIRSSLLRKGFYRNKDGQPIFSLKDIKGAIFDADDNEIISAEDLKRFKAFYTRNGSLLYTLGKGFISLGQWGVQTAVKGAKAYGRMVGSFYQALWKGVKGVGSRVGRFLKRGFGVGAGTTSPGEELNTAGLEVSLEQLKVQTNIRDMLKARFDAEKRDKWDLDKDGVRENSWADILRRRRAKADTKASTGEGDVDSAAIVAAIDRLGDRLDDNFDDLEDVVEEAGEDSLLDMAADADDLMDRRGRRGRGGRGGRGTGRLGRLGRGLKGGLGRMGGSLLRGGGGLLRGGAGLLGRGALMALPAIASGAMAVGGGILSGLGAIASGIGAVLSAPLVIGAALLGGAAYLGYRYYKSSKAKEYPILYLRMTQYGIEPTDQTKVEKVLQLEGMLKSHIRGTKKGEMSISTEGLNVPAVLDLFGATGDEDRTKNLLMWISKRFRPVYLAHCAAMQRVRGSYDLEQADTGMSTSEVETYLDIVNLANMKEVYDDDETSPFDDDLDTDADDVTSAFEMVRARQAKKTGDVAVPPTMLSARGIHTDTLDTRVDKKVAAVSQKGTNDPSELRRNLRLTAVASAGLGMAYTAGQRVTGTITSLNIPTAVRYKVYGLKDLTIDRVEQLNKIELLTWNRIVYNGTETAVISGSVEELEQQIIDLIKPPHQPAELQVILWIRYRYLPAILQYAISCRRRYNGPAQDAYRNMTGVLMREVLQEMTETQVETPDGKKSVWTVENSPWLGEPLETSAGSTTLYIDALDKGDKKGPLPVDGLTAQDRYSTENDKYPNKLTNIALGNTRDVNSKIGSMGNPYQNYLDIYGKGQVAGGVKGQSPTGYGDGSMLMTGSMGIEVQHPGGGSDGDINQVPVPKGDGWEGMKDTIIAAAEMQGFDPKIAATVAAIESSFKARAKAPTSSAAGLFQFINETWKDMMTKYGPRFGIAPGTTQYDARANAILGVRYLIDNYNYLKERMSGPVTDTALYTAHFMGPGGAAKLLSGNLNSPASSVTSDAVIRANRDIFTDKGRLRTVGGVIAELDRRVGKARKMHTLGTGTDTTVQAPTTPQAPGSEAPASGIAGAEGFSGTGSESTMTEAPTQSTTAGTIPALETEKTAKAAEMASGASSPTGVSTTPTPAVVQETAPTKTSATRASVEQAQQTLQVEAKVSMEITEKLLEQQLTKLGSIDGTLKDIKAHIATMAKQSKDTSQRTASTAPTPQPRPEPRHPLNTGRKNAVT